MIGYVVWESRIQDCQTVANSVWDTYLPSNRNQARYQLL
jgi:hypothetical protein